ncbi:MAG: Omp28-related outer membrane protein [Saprospiraceae bacterium]|nr:Omp28-related outer membrane protein [Saprospiraceae bacterium]
MKKHNLLLFLLLAAWAAHAQTSTKKYVFIEHFTNTKCPNCANRNPAFYNLINQYPNDIHHISIHPPYPYNTCGLYQANPAENSARASYYSVFGTPSIAMNGALQPSSNPLLSNATLQNFLGQTSPLWLQVSESGSGNARTVTVNAHSLGNIPTGAYKLYVAIVEKVVNFAGGNGETVHYDVFRKMATDINGADFTPAAMGQSVSASFNFNISGSWNANEIYTIAWVQNTATKEVLNSGTRFDPLVTSTQEPAPQSIQIQPNPASEVAFARIGDDTAQQVEVFAVNGRQASVTFEHAEAGAIRIPTATLPAGVYFVKIRGEKGVYVAKMVKN